MVTAIDDRFSLPGDLLGPGPASLRKAAESVDALLSLVRDLGRLTAAGGAARDLELGPVITTAIALCRSLEDPRVPIVADLAHGVRASADEPRLVQVLVTLLAHATADAPAGTCASIRVAHGPTIEIRAQGPRMTHAALKRLLDPLHAVRATDEDLQLLVAADVARAFGATLRAEAGEGGGGRLVLALSPAKPTASGARGTPRGP